MFLPCNSALISFTVSFLRVASDTSIGTAKRVVGKLIGSAGKVFDCTAKLNCGRAKLDLNVTTLASISTGGESQGHFVTTVAAANYPSVKPTNSRSQNLATTCFIEAAVMPSVEVASVTVMVAECASDSENSILPRLNSIASGCTVF